jgi:hypothetical protein
MAGFNLNTFLQENSEQTVDTDSVYTDVSPDVSTGFNLKDHLETSGFSLNTFLENSSIPSIQQEAEDYTEAEAYAHAAWLGLSDTGRGVLQFMGIAEEGMQDDKELLKALEKKYGAGITATYIGGMIADPVGWVVPVAKVRTVGKLAWEGAKWGGLAGGLGYVDEEEGQTRLGNLTMGAATGTVVAPVFGKAIQGASKIKDLVINKNADEIFDNPVGALAEIGEAPSSMAQNIKSAYIKPFQKGDSSDKDRTNWAHRVVFSNPGVFLGGATGGALGGAQEHDSPAANIFGWTVAGAAMGATGFRAVGALGKGTSTNNFLGRMAKGEGGVADFMSNAFIENHGLKAKYSDVIKMKEDNFADANNIGYQFLDIAAQMQKLTPEENQLLYQFLDGRLGKTDLTPDLLTIGEESRKAITAAGQRLVDVGALDKNVWKSNIENYIHRSYLKHLPEGARPSAFRQIWANDNVRLMADELRMRGKVQEFVRPKEGVEAWRQEKAAEGWEFLKGTAKEKRKDAFRYNYTPEQRAEMGEIEHAAFAMLETGKLYNNDIAALGLYNDVFKAHARIDAKSIKALDEEATKMLNNGRFPDEDARNAWVKERTPEQALAIDEEEILRLGLRQVPNTKLKGSKINLFGKLSGSYIPKEIYDDLIAFKNHVSKYDEAGSLGRTSRKLFQTYRLGNQLWKRTKTSWNPTVHANNIMSNMILMDLLDVPYKFLNVGRHVFTKKGRELLNSKYDNLYNDLTRFGVLDSGLATKELGFASNKWADAYQDKILKGINSPEEVVEGSARIANKVYKQVRNPLNLPKKGLKLLDQEATSLYQKEDQMFRIALYKHRLDEGMKKITSTKGTPEFTKEVELLKRNAAKQAKRGFIDYDIQAPGIKVLRETFNPFISYTYRVIPLLAETATLRPMKFAKWAAVGYGLNFVGRELSEGNEEAERGMMSSQALQHMFGVPFMPYTTIKMPDRVGKLFTMGFDKDPLTGKEFPNRSMYLNTSRWIPGGDVLGLTGQAGAEGMRIPGLPAPLQPSGGLMGDIIYSLVIGQDAFTGKKINSVQEGEASALVARSKHLFKKLLPNNPLIGDFGLFPDEESFRSYSQRKILRALNAGEATGQLPGRYELPVLQAVAQTIGIKLHPFEPRVESQLRTFEYKNKISKFKSEARRIQRQVYSGVMSSEEGAEIIEELRQELDEVLFRHRKMEKSSYKAKGYKEGGVIEEAELGEALSGRDLATQMAELEGEMSGVTPGASKLTGATEGERTIGETIPGISEGIDIADLAKAVREDDPWGMGISAASLAIGAIPFVGDVLRQSFRTFTKPVVKQLEDADRLINSDQLEVIQTAKRKEVSEIKSEKARELNEISGSKIGDINYIDPEKFGGKGYRKYPEEVSDLKKILSTEGITDAERLDAIQKTKAITFGKGYGTSSFKWGIPPRTFNADEIDNIVPTFEDMVTALGQKRIKKQGLLGFSKEIPEGYTHEGLTVKNGRLSLKDNVFVESRLDITAYQKYNTWIASVKLAEGEGPSSMFSKVAVLQRSEGKPMFELIESAEEKAMNIGEGSGKGPFATIQGNWQDVTPEAAINRAKEAINSKEYIQVGYDPDRASYFFDKVTGEPVLDAEEIIQIGPLVLAKFRKPDETQLEIIEKLMTQKYSSGGFIDRERIN